MALDQPLLVVAPLEGGQGRLEVGEGGERLDPQEVLFQGADEALGAAVALGLPDVGGRAGDAEIRQLLLEGGRAIDAAVVVADGPPGGDAGVIAAEGGGTAWRMGSRASKRVPRVAACRPTHAAVQ